MKYSGKYFQRRIPYASHGSFNPYIISNKEAHIVNGNIRVSYIKENEATSSSQQLQEANSNRRHFMNYCLTHSGRFSCAVDSFLELAFAIFRDSLQHVERNEFFQTLFEACVHLQSCNVETDMTLIREPVWAYLRQHCNSFATMSADAVFSDIFKLSTVGVMTQELQSLFLVKERNQSVCSLCNNAIIKNTSIFVIYITCQNWGHSLFGDYVSEAILPSSKALFCNLCQQHSGNISVLQHFVILPKFLLIELASTCIDQVYFPHIMDVLGQSYELKGMVRCASHHFTVAINNHSEWIYIDDLCVSVRSFTSIQDLLDNYPNDWFFAVFEKSSPTLETDLQPNSPTQEVFSRDKCYETMQDGTQSQVPNMFFKSGKFSSSPYQIDEKSKQDDTLNKRKRTRSEIKEVDKRLKLDTQQNDLKKNRNKKSDGTNSISKLKKRANENECRRQYNKKKMPTSEADKLRERIKNRAYIKEYREKKNVKKKMPTNEADKQRKRIRDKEYMKDYRKKTTFKKMPTNEADKLRKRIKNKEYMKDYRKKTTEKTNEADKLRKRIRDKEYMKDYRKKTAFKKMPINEADKLRKTIKNKEYMSDYRKRKKSGLNNSVSKMKIVNNQTTCEAGTQFIEKKTKQCPVVSQDKYLSRFDAKTYGQLHHQQWAAINIKRFHKSMIFKIWHCRVCHEAWPLSVKNKKQPDYVCSRCVRDKNSIKKFSAQNSMVPAQVPKELQGLTQIEEMLIARAFPVISVYTKPGGQRAYKGHCINFPQDIQELADTLPRYPKELPIIVITVEGKDNATKDLIVRRQRVSMALQWLVKHNPVYKDIKIDYTCLSSLPTEGLPSDLQKVHCTKISENEIDPDRGPLDSDEIPFNHETELSSTLLNPVVLKSQKQLIKDELLQHHKTAWPNRGIKPLSEFKIQLLATMAFPTLFPDGTGDPTNTATKRHATLGEKVKHLIKFAEIINGKWVYRFASHPRFAYWAFNMIQRHRLLGQGSIFLKQNPNEAHLTVEQLKKMLTTNSYSSLMSKLMHYAKNITGSSGYWQKSKEDLKATISQKGPPTIFFTLSCAEYHWPEFHNLLSNSCTEKLTPGDRHKNVLNNPHLLDWLFSERTDRFVKFWLKESLQSSWHWYRFEYAVQRGSIHCHGVAKLKNDPGLCTLTEKALNGYIASKYKTANQNELSKEQIMNINNEIHEGKEAAAIVCRYVDFLLSTWNPSSPDDGWSKPQIHPCQKSYLSLKTNEMADDYVHLLNSVERHTTCSTNYCLRQNDKSELHCRFNFPYDDCPDTRLDFEPINTKTGETKYKAVIVTKRNDSRLNRHQPLQLQGWRANCDIQIVIDYHACLEYLVKYTSKAERASSVVKNAFTNIITKMNDTIDTPSALKQILLKTVGQRDYSIQEVMHHLLSIKFVSATHEVITASLDGSRRVQLRANSEICTAPSMLDTYAERYKYLKIDPQLLEYNFVEFASRFTFKASKLTRRDKTVIVKTYPNYSSNPKSEDYGLFCKYQLLKYKPWQSTPNDAWDNLAQDDETYTTCWKKFLLTDTAKSLVPDWETKMQAVNNYISITPFNDDSFEEDYNTESEREEWMLMAELAIQTTDTCEQSTPVPHAYWHQVYQHFTNEEINAMPTWINREKNKSSAQYSCETRTIDTSTFSKMQQVAYQIVSDHFTSGEQNPLRFLIMGVAGTGKSYLIDSLRNLLQGKCKVLAYTGKASFNVNGVTLHSLLKLPIGSKRHCDLKGIPLQQLQSNLENVQYLIIDEYSFVGQSLLGWIDNRCRQATGRTDMTFGGISVILVGDIAQLPPVGDKPLYHSMPKTEKQIQGFFLYHEFKKVVKLTVNQRVQGNNIEQSNFREILTRARHGESNESDWHSLISRTPDKVDNLNDFEKNSVRLCYHKEKVAELNMTRLKSLGQPIAVIKARHSIGAQKLSADDMGGLEPIVYLSKGAKVMLTINLWTDVGLCNGALGTVLDFVYADGQQPPCLPICVLVQFDDEYKGPSVSSVFQRCVPICPITQVSESLGKNYERQQLPLKLAWAMTIHKCQGLTLTKAWIDLGSSERTPGITYVALSRVKKIQDLLIEPMTLERLQAVKKSTNFKFRLEEENRLDMLANETLNSHLKIP